MKPKELYRQVIHVWSDQPIDQSVLESVVAVDPALYWVFGEEELVSDPQTFPSTTYFDDEQ